MNAIAQASFAGELPSRGAGKLARVMPVKPVDEPMTASNPRMVATGT